ncbi:MAG: hypothetical protein P4M00_00425 [Azospirillaceae bacterium]|nr:hypothetical protein [Azospirillaceae bacterium]
MPNLDVTDPFGQGINQLTDVYVVRSTTIKGNYQAIIPHVDVPSAYGIGIWSGSTAGSPNSPITSVPVTNTKGEFDLTADGYHFQQGAYTLGLYYNTNDGERQRIKIYAAVDIRAGQPIRQQLSKIHVSGQKTVNGSSILEFKYTRPESNNLLIFNNEIPVDQIYLLPEVSLSSFNSDSSNSVFVPAQPPSGTTTMTSIYPLTRGAKYTVGFYVYLGFSILMAYETFEWNPLD